MPNPSIIIIGKKTERRRVVVQAAKSAFPAGPVTTVEKLGDAPAGGGNQHPTFLVLTDSTAKELAKIREANIPRLFPEPEIAPDRDPARGRFAILLKGKGDAGVLIQIFQATLFQYRLLCENFRMRGDLRTVAQRVNHDLRTPLGGIVTMGEVLKHEMKRTAPDRVHLLDGIFRSTDELNQLIGRISFLLKASSNAPAIGLVRMGEPVAAALQQLAPKIIKENASIVQPASWPEVRGVPTWLEVIWWNLIVNALQHGGPGRIEIGWKKNADGHQFWVADRGPGVPEARRSRLFVPFDLLHEPEARTGLGLSIVRRLVEIQGGGCDYEQNGAGARFSFTLPLAPWDGGKNSK